MDNPWRYATNLSDAYFGSAGNQTAMLGQSSKASADLDAKLLINNTTATYPYINFKNGSTSLADIMLYGNSLVFGGPYSSSDSFKMGNNKGNTAFGIRSLWRANSSAQQDTAVGYEALKYNTSGEANTAVGYNALGNSTTAGANTAVGWFALAYHNGMSNTALGYEALKGIPSTSTFGTGIRNTGVGEEAGRRITTGDENTAVGFASLGAGDHNDEKAVTGDKNTAVGAWSMNTITTGSGNTAIGYNSLSSNESGGNNVAIGNGALKSNNSGSGNVIIGSSAADTLQYSSYVTAVGYNAYGGKTDSAANKNDYTTAIGYNAGTLNYNTGYDQHLYLGAPAMHYNKYTRAMIEGHHKGNSKYIILNGDVVVTGHLLVNNSVFADAVYTDSDPEGASNAQNNVFRAVRIYDGGANSAYSMPKSSNAYKYVTVPKDNEYKSGTSSDKRLKNIKGENNAGLEQIRKLKVFDYSFKADKSKTPRVGVIAQDLQKVFPDAVTQGHDGFLLIRQEDMFYAMVNAIKQLDTIVQALITEVKVDLAKVLKHDAEIKQLQKENAKIMQTNAELQAKNAELEKRIEKLEKAMSK